METYIKIGFVIWVVGLIVLEVYYRREINGAKSESSGFYDDYFYGGEPQRCWYIHLGWPIVALLLMVIVVIIHIEEFVIRRRKNKDQ